MNTPRFHSGAQFGGRNETDLNLVSSPIWRRIGGDEPLDEEAGAEAERQGEGDAGDAAELAILDRDAPGQGAPTRLAVRTLAAHRRRKRRRSQAAWRPSG